MSKEDDTLIHKKHVNGKVLSPGRACAISIPCETCKHDSGGFSQIFSGYQDLKDMAFRDGSATEIPTVTIHLGKLRSIDAATLMQLRSISHDSYDQFAEIFSSRYLQYPTLPLQFLKPKNQSVPWLSPHAIWTANEMPCWHNPRKSELTVFGVCHVDWS